MITILLLTFLTLASDDHSALTLQLDCLTELESLCKNEKDLNDCMIKDENLKKLPLNCQKTTNCHNEVKKICPDKKNELNHLNCLKQKQNLFSAECRKIVVPADDTIDYMTYCEKDVERICPENEKLLLSDPVKASADQEECLKKNSAKFHPKCQTLLKKD